MRLIRIFMGLGIVFVSGVLLVARWIIPFTKLRDRCVRRIGYFWARSMLWVLGVRVRVDPPGVSKDGAALHVANHTGYLDILVVMSASPGAFISREGIAWWPVVGQLAALGGSVFVDRRNRFSIVRSIEKIRVRLRAGMNVIFFPEGTSSNGERLLPFKSSLFAAAVGKGGEKFPIRPLVLRYHTIGGEPVCPANRDRVYWYGDMSMPMHLWGMLTAPGIDVTVKPLAERTLSGNRKQFAAQLREEMQREFEILGTRA